MTGMIDSSKTSVPAPFVKLFEDDKWGQILVTLDNTTDDPPGVEFHFKGPAYLDVGICTARIGLRNDDRGVELAQELFDNMTLEGAKSIVEEFCADILSALPAGGSA